ncbi:hypothetical protein BKA70DRAFT_1433343 [Coprinopsis sp. MPI-PUGE-AT-0042]|nr:hypothetical protein BKA70DRAFT_680901 [Coprinopsis sp. MPI-PUGE-AT-0042]KAH6903720.1 hypothetical protein BKA70DRAFT_1433343 [Coprinopsis sp. MPI-PUGE-AT-0042]
MAPPGATGRGKKVSIVPWHKGHSISTQDLKILTEEEIVPGNERRISLGLRTFLALLDRSLIGTDREIRSREGTALSNAERGFLALHGLTRLIAIISDWERHPSYERISKLVLSSVDPLLGDIAAWLSFGLRHSPSPYLREHLTGITNACPILLLCITVQNGGYLHADPETRQSGYANEALIDVAVSAWAMRYVELGMPAPERCSNSDFFSTIIDPPEGVKAVNCLWIQCVRGLLIPDKNLALFRKRWIAFCASKGLNPSTLLVQSILSRLYQVHTASERLGRAASKSCGDILLLGTIVSRLATPCHDMTNAEREWTNGLMQAFYMAEGVRHFTQTILALSNRSFNEERATNFREHPLPSLAIPVRCVQTTYEVLIKGLLIYPASCSSAARKLLKRGLLEIVGNAGYTLSQYTPQYRDSLHPETFEAIDYALRAVMVLISVLPSLHASVLPLRNRMPAHALIGQGWAMENIVKFQIEGPNRKTGTSDDFWMNAEVFKELYSICQNVIVLCENAGHFRNGKLLYDTGLRSQKECARCQFKVYCSRACQREDWDVRHRMECPALRHLSLVFRQEDTFYHHRHRAWHIFLIQSHYRERNGFEEVHLKGAPATIFLVDMRSVPMNFYASSAPALEPFDTLHGELANVRFRNDFRQWAEEREFSKKLDDGTVQIERLLAGKCSYGGRIITIVLKTRITKLAPRAQGLQILVLDSIYGIR